MMRKEFSIKFIPTGVPFTARTWKLLERCVQLAESLNDYLEDTPAEVSIEFSVGTVLTNGDFYWMDKHFARLTHQTKGSEDKVCGERWIFDNFERHLLKRLRTFIESETSRLTSLQKKLSQRGNKRHRTSAKATC